MKLKRTNPAPKSGAVISDNSLHHAIYALAAGLADGAMKSKGGKLVEVKSIIGG